MNDTTTPPPSNDVALAKPQILPVIDDGEFAELLDSNRFAQIQRVAKLFAESDLIPATFHKKEANCAVALQMAFRLRVDPMMLMQNIYIVQGRPGMEGKLAIALINARGPFTGPLQWQFNGDKKTPGRSCTAFATHRSTGERCELTITWETVVGEGWTKNSKWTTMEEQMFRYRTASWFGRAYCPEVLLGLPTVDELDDMQHAPRAVTGSRVDEGVEVIHLPRAKAQTPTGEAPAVDVTTGETVQQQQDVAEAGAATPAASNGEAKQEAQGTAQQGTLIDPPADGMKTKASEAQRTMIISMAKRLGYTVAQLDELLIEKLTIGIDELPLALVSNATMLVRSLQPLKPAA